MNLKFDVDKYRKARLATSAHKPVVHMDVVDALANPANLALWKEGIVKPDFQSESHAYSHFTGFRNALVDRATREAHGDGSQRFRANDIEQVLDSQAVEDFAKAHAATDPSTLSSLAAEFYVERMTPLIKARRRPSA